MSEMSPEAQGQQNNDAGTGSDSGQQQQYVQTTESQPPYYDELQQVPEALRPTVEPIFKSWDQKVNQRFEQQSQQYQPWNDIINQYQPQDVDMAIQFAVALRDNPQEVLTNLAQSLGYDIDDEDLEGLDPDDPSSEKMQALEKGFSDFVEMYQKDQQERQDAATEQEIMQYLNAVSQHNAEQFGPLDVEGMKEILEKASVTDDLEGAVNWYYSKLARPINNSTPKQTPQVLGAGGSLPSQNQQDLSKLGAKETKNLVAELLNAANQQ